MKMISITIYRFICIILFRRSPVLAKKRKFSNIAKKKEDQRCKILDLLFNTVLEIEMPGPE
jgi:hypothetical protein